MYDSGRYRDRAEECLLAAEACESQPCKSQYRELFRSMATAWLLLARQDEEMDHLLARGDTAPPVENWPPVEDRQPLVHAISPLANAVSPVAA